MLGDRAAVPAGERAGARQLPGDNERRPGSHGFRLNPLARTTS
jgi:hypothetical protein